MPMLARARFISCRPHAHTGASMTTGSCAEDNRNRVQMQIVGRKEVRLHLTARVLPCGNVPKQADRTRENPTVACINAERISLGLFRTAPVEAGALMASHRDAVAADNRAGRGGATFFLRRPVSAAGPRKPSLTSARRARTESGAAGAAKAACLFILDCPGIVIKGADARIAGRVVQTTWPRRHPLRIGKSTSGHGRL